MGLIIRPFVLFFNLSIIAGLCFFDASYADGNRNPLETNTRQVSGESSSLKKATATACRSVIQKYLRAVNGRPETPFREGVSGMDSRVAKRVEDAAVSLKKELTSFAGQRPYVLTTTDYAFGDAILDRLEALAKDSAQIQIVEIDASSWFESDPNKLSIDILGDRVAELVQDVKKAREEGVQLIPVFKDAHSLLSKRQEQTIAGALSSHITNGHISPIFLVSSVRSSDLIKALGGESFERLSGKPLSYSLERSEKLDLIRLNAEKTLQEAQYSAVKLSDRALERALDATGSEQSVDRALLILDRVFARELGTAQHHDYAIARAERMGLDEQLLQTQEFLSTTSSDRKAEIEKRIKELTEDLKKKRSAEDRAFQELQKAVSEVERIITEEMIGRVIDTADLFLSENEAWERAQSLESSIGRDVLGQDAPIATISRATRAHILGFRRGNRPLIVYMGGPTGVGKTETAKAFTRRMTGSEDNLVVVEGGDFQESYRISEIRGSAAGHIGSDEATQVSRSLSEKSNAVLLLDELEKMHPSIRMFWMNAIEKGGYFDARGQWIPIRYLFIGSNLGVDEMLKAHAEGIDIQSPEFLQGTLLPLMRRTYSPEFVGRLPVIVTYNVMTSELIERILRRRLEDLDAVMTRRKMTMNISDEAIKAFAQLGLDMSSGARGIEDQLIWGPTGLSNIFADLVSAGIETDLSMLEGSEIRVDMTEDGGMRFQLVDSNESTLSEMNMPAEALRQMMPRQELVEDIQSEGDEYLDSFGEGSAD